MPGLTCNSCNEEFDDDAEQKLHYKSEWHRYNLKRKEEENTVIKPLPRREVNKHHGFFIPDVEYLKDPQGLLTYLGLKVKRDFLCLYCVEDNIQHISKPSTYHKEHELNKATECDEEESSKSLNSIHEREGYLERDKEDHD